MSLPKLSSNMLRTAGLRPAARTVAPLVRSTQVRAVTQPHNPSRDNLGGPGGQQPPPANPGGAPDVLKRNWMAIAGGALAVLVAYSYISKNPNEAREQRDKTLGEMSGRKKTEMAGFRHD